MVARNGRIGRIKVQATQCQATIRQGNLLTLSHALNDNQAGL
jgi:hypothetical protein